MLEDRLNSICGLLCEDETIASYVIEGEYCRRYIITPNKDLALIDVAGAMEDTLHRLLDHRYTPDEIYEITGMDREEPKEDESVTEIDLGYRLHGQIVSMDLYADMYRNRSKNWKPYLIRSLTPGITAITAAVVVASSEEIALRKVMAEYPGETGWYAEVIEPEDGVKVIVG